VEDRGEEGESILPFTPIDLHIIQIPSYFFGNIPIHLQIAYIMNLRGNMRIKNGRAFSKVRI